LNLSMPCTKNQQNEGTLIGTPRQNSPCDCRAMH
jgi:hypothetical protein